jgi:hypothetical protein
LDAANVRSNGKNTTRRKLIVDQLRTVLLVALFILTPCAYAGPLIIADDITPGCENGVAILTITLNKHTYGFYDDGLFYHFDPFSPGTVAPAGGNPVVVPIPAGFAAGSNHAIQMTTSASATAPGASSSAVYQFMVPLCRSGMTWNLITTNAPTGTVRVGCGTSCDARKGDTPCIQPLPLLCIRKSGTGFPLARPASVVNNNMYLRWSGGIIGTTAAMLPPSTLAAANSVCVQQFGVDWRVAEFHDGWGWSFQAYGGVGNPASRFWVHINDQPGATCWQ